MNKLFFSFFLFACLASAAPVSPYAGQEGREIKALAADEIEGYLSGKGMGFAKAAELNGYPGPSHVMALASELALSPEQKRRTEALFRQMEAEAIALGSRLIEQERILDQQFAAKTVSNESLATLMKNIGETQGQIRRAHLAAHLEQTSILTSVQVVKYMEMRGYSGTMSHNHQHMH